MSLNSSVSMPFQTNHAAPVRAVRDISETAVVRAKDFSLYYGDKKAVDRVTMDIETGGVTAIIGPSGCGKSTFLRSVNRMNDLIPNTKTEGLLMIRGQDVYDRRIDLVALRRHVGMVFQRPNPFPKSIYDNIAYGPRLQGIRKRTILNDIIERSLRSAAL